MKNSQLLVLLNVVFIWGCSNSAPIPDAATRCEAPRVKMCTREYRPVCGVKANSLAKTYGNPCSACSDSDVVYVLSGECTGKKPQMK